MTVIIDDAVSSERNPGPSPFVLKPGAGRTARVTALVNNQTLTLAEASGPWAGFQLMQQADAWRTVGTSPNFDWALHSGPGTVAQLPNGTPIKFTFELSAGDAPAIMKPGYASRRLHLPVPVRWRRSLRFHRRRPLHDLRAAAGCDTVLRGLVQ